MSKGVVKLPKLSKGMKVKIAGSSSAGNISKVDAEKCKEEFLTYALSQAKESGLDISESFFDKSILKIVSEEKSVTVPALRKAARVSTGAVGTGVVKTGGAGGTPNTVKFSNYFVEFNFDKALESIGEIAKAIKPKNSELELIIYIIATVIWLRKASKVEISNVAAAVVDWLHKNGHHKTPCTEENVINGVIKEYKKEDGSSLSKDEIVASVTFLNRYHVIHIKEEKIKLVETVKARK